MRASCVSAKRVGCCDMPFWLAVALILIVFGTVAVMVAGIVVGGGREALVRQQPQLVIAILVVAGSVGVIAFASLNSGPRSAVLIAGITSLAVLTWVGARRTLPARMVIPIGAVVLVVVLLTLIR